MIKIVLINIPIKYGIVGSNLNTLLYCSDQAMVLPPYDVEIIRCGIVSQSGCYALGWERVPSGAPYTFPTGSWMFPLCTLHCIQVPPDWYMYIAALFYSMGSWSLGLTNNCFKVLFPLK